ncbi:hypothetical protein C7271_08145 [filamentous cyanobacterium CCP5]|nr:hypothetical protein C7271_08145 [filamentous cyanobacterium CCP5]
MSFPAIIPDTQAKRFKFLNDHSLYEGMAFEGHFYKLLRVYGGGDRAKAFERGCELSTQGRVVISTHDSQVYSLWIDVRMPLAAFPVLDLSAQNPIQEASVA